MSEYGLSTTHKSAYSVNSQGKRFLYHTLPEVTAVTPNTGADSGGTFLTLQGLGFDGYKDNTQVRWWQMDFIYGISQFDPKVFVNDALCENVDVTATSLTCKTPAQAAVGSSQGGPRGLK